MQTLLIPAQGKWRQADPEVSLARQPKQLGEFQSNERLWFKTKSLWHLQKIIKNTNLAFSFCIHTYTQTHAYTHSFTHVHMYTHKYTYYMCTQND